MAAKIIRPFAGTAYKSAHPHFRVERFLVFQGRREPASDGGNRDVQVSPTRAT
ncbi:MAG: hypothetical protein V3S89_14785 [Desulfobacterales bacterium]